MKASNLPTVTLITLRPTNDDIEVLEMIKAWSGISSTSDVIRYALRELQRSRCNTEYIQAQLETQTQDVLAAK